MYALVNLMSSQLRGDHPQGPRGTLLFELYLSLIGLTNVVGADSFPLQS